jgi:two-component system chemotaxis sensor kinase CheA
VNGPHSEFLEIFRDEARERLDRVVEVLLAVESGTASADAIDSLFRETHTIKGAAGMVGLDEIRTLAHAMEDALGKARDHGTITGGLVGPLLRSADALRQHVDGAGESTAELVAELHAIVTGPPSTERFKGSLPEGAPRRRTERRSIRVAPEKIDTLLDLVGETVLHRRRLEHALDNAAATTHRVVTDELDHGERLLDGLKDAAVGMRTLPLSTIVGPLSRAVRDLAAESEKEAELVLTGTETELDRGVLEGLSEVLVHVIRNAVAHGIESPEERTRLGKPERGRVELRAEQRGSIVELTVSDDGRGVSAEMVAEASRSSLADVLARAGFSTAGEVSSISGRGVGLDAVKKHVEGVGGALEIRSETGTGTDVVIRLPLALALLDVLLVERCGSVYGVPLASVEEAVALGETMSLAGRPSLELRGRSVPLGDLAALVGAAASPQEERSLAVVVTASGRRVAAICDRLLGKEEVVVKSLGPLLQSLGTYLGAAILGDGRIALLVDPVFLVREEAVRGAVARAERPVVAGQVVRTDHHRPKVLVVEDSFSVREIQRGILEAAGYRVEVARDGVEALERLNRDTTIELVLTDVEMPQMDGIELTRTIRADPARSGLPIVIVTSLGEEADRQRGADAGADAYMVKRSFDQQALLETVDRLTAR